MIPQQAPQAEQMGRSHKGRRPSLGEPGQHGLQKNVVARVNDPLRSGGELRADALHAFEIPGQVGPPALAHLPPPVLRVPQETQDALQGDALQRPNLVLNAFHADDMAPHFVGQPPGLQIHGLAPAMPLQKGIVQREEHRPGPVRGHNAPHVGRTRPGHIGPTRQPALRAAHHALKAADLLAAEGISARVIDMHTIKPLDEELVLKAAKETGAIVTTEEANVLGGLGAAVCEFLAGTCPVPVIRHGVEDVFGRSGVAPKVLEAYGITAEGIAAKAEQALKMKK